VYFQAGNTAVVWAQNAQTIDLLKGAGATMPEFPEEVLAFLCAWRVCVIY
jgi:hypothetical protein